MNDENVILDKTMKATKNLMIIEIKDRRDEIDRKILEIDNCDEYKIAQGNCRDIINSEKSEIISNTKWLQNLVEATQDAIFTVGAENIYNLEDQENDIFSECTGPLTDDALIITAENVITSISADYFNAEQRLEVKYAVNPLLFPLLDVYQFKESDYYLKQSEMKHFIKVKDFERQIDDLSEEKSILRKKERDMEDILLRVETDLLLKQVKCDAIGSRSLTTIKDLVNKHLHGKELPGGMSLLT